MSQKLQVPNITLSKELDNAIRRRQSVEFMRVTGDSGILVSAFADSSHFMVRVPLSDDFQPQKIVIDRRIRRDEHSLIAGSKVFYFLTPFSPPFPPFKTRYGCRPGCRSDGFPRPEVDRPSRSGALISGIGNSSIGYVAFGGHHVTRCPDSELNPRNHGCTGVVGYSLGRAPNVLRQSRGMRTPEDSAEVSFRCP